MLKRGLDKVTDSQPVLALPQAHDHVRGPAYYADYSASLDAPLDGSPDQQGSIDFTHPSSSSSSHPHAGTAND